MEHMSDKELETLRNLQAKAKRVARKEEEFLKEVDDRKNELMKRFNQSDRLDEIAKQLHTETEILSDWLLSKEHKELFKKAHQPGAESK